MKKILTLAAIAAAMMALTSCGCEQKKTQECKFNAEQYAEEHTARLNEIVTLTEEQNKEVKAIFLEEAKEVEANIKEMKAECDKAECKKATCDKKAECDKAECNKATCDKKAECNKAECNKATCDKKAECNKKAECKKATCDKKAECDKAECKKATCDKKAECNKAECKKATCDKKAECNKAECKKATCDKKAECNKAECNKEGKHHNHCMVSPATKKANMEKIKALLTPEQVALLDAHRAQKSECMQPTECCTAK